MELRRVFDRAAQGWEAGQILSELTQGNQSVADYVIEFCTLAISSVWNNHTMWDLFLRGLYDTIQDKIYPLALPHQFDDLVNLAIRIDQRLTHRRHLSLPS